MNLSPKQPLYSPEEKYNFYRLAAKRFKSELRLYGATAAIHLENKNDEVFWGKVLHHVYPQGKWRFITSSRSISGHSTAGCTQCLQYKDFLDDRFWIAIDSDYRYLNQQPDIDAHHSILQTYTYSFENHFCYADNVNRAELEACGGVLRFDFVRFLRDYSRIIYPLLVWQLYLQGAAPEAFPQKVFHRLITLPCDVHATTDDGRSILQRLEDRTRKMCRHFARLYPDADPTWYEARCNDLGVKRDNCYLFVRGHQLYDLIVNIGERLRQEAKRDARCTTGKGRHADLGKTELATGNGRNATTGKAGDRSFVYYLESNLCYGKYDEIRRVADDIRLALHLDPDGVDGEKESRGF